ncbi:MAG: acetylglucosamine-6-sulfatase, partial [Verrucomicrobia bacterium]|nr:acetylglucosamine-6-sulfatase [Verrucomicrobiota bacterium]
MKSFLKKLLFAGAALSVATSFGDLPRTVTPERQNEWWHARHEEKLAEIVNRGDQIDLVFIGDSITHFIDSSAAGLVQEVFPGIQHLNLGFSADKTENVLWRLRNGELDGISPQLVIIMIGTNNTGHRQDEAEVTAAAIDLIVQEVRQRVPDAQVILHSIFPRGAGPDDSLRMLNEEINALLPAIAAGDEKVMHLDINDEFLDQDEVLSTDIMPDLLHPNADGYDIWMDAIEP